MTALQREIIAEFDRDTVTPVIDCEAMLYLIGGERVERATWETAMLNLDYLRNECGWDVEAQ